ncbi:MAG: hypothetical protein JWR63_1335 [Conexibacter sp.]|nr:hypothetical protein [Conexibacter sp.]
MATVFFHYFLRPDADAHEFERRILADVAVRALAEQSVKTWVLHRSEPWPGGSENVPDYVCVVEVQDLGRWSADAAASITESHGALGPLVREIGMLVSVESLVPRSPGVGAT